MRIKQKFEVNKMKLINKIKGMIPKFNKSINLIERIALFGKQTIEFLNKIGSFLSVKILTVDNQEKLNDLGHFRGFKRSALLLRMIIWPLMLNETTNSLVTKV